MAKRQNQNKSWLKIKKLTTDIHLWLGLIGGIVIFVLCLTGTIYVFSSEIQQALEPSLYKVQNNSGKLKEANELVQKVESFSQSTAQSLTIPEKNNELYSIAVKNPEGKGRPVTYQIDPYTAEIKGIYGKGKGSEFFFTVFKLHRWFLLDDKIGRPITGLATLFFAIGCITGLVIWFPNKIKHWKQGLKIKTDANWKRINHDLHSTLGFYSFIFITVMALTGLCWSYEWYKDGLSKVLGAPVFAHKGAKPVLSAGPAEDSHPLSINELVQIGEKELTYSGNLRIALPKEQNEVVTFTKTKNGFFASNNSDKVLVNQYDGSVVSYESFKDKKLNEKIANSIRALHTGEIWGMFSKILYFISCLIATSLPITGTIIWWNKLKKKNKKNKKTLISRKQTVSDKELVLD